MNRFLTRPLYLHLRDLMVERIVSGQWTPGTMLSNESELARAFGVSIGTMRRTLVLMEAMRLLTRRQGIGTFVNDPSSRELAGRYDSRGRADGTSISDEVSTGEVTESLPNEAECARLRLTRDDNVYRLSRRRIRDGRTYMVEDVSMPATLFPGLADEQNPCPSIAVVAAQYSVLLGTAEERISVGEALPEVAEALAVPFGSPVLALDRVVFALDGRPLEWRMAWCHPPEGHCFAETK